MCGICGVFSYAKTGGFGADDIVRMSDTMRHRGPDGSGWLLYDAGARRAVTQRDAPSAANGVNPRVGFGHRRLSIIDLSAAGTQPMSNEDGTVWITYNGEVYNHAALRAELEAKGHVYRSRTDSETIVHAYEEWGDDCVQKFQGMFGFAIYDTRSDRLLLVRDRIGIKPVYYSFIPGRVVFASEIKAILEFPGIERDIDTAAMYQYLTFLTTPAPLTLFKGIFKIPAGHMITVESDGKTRVRQYWDLAEPMARRAKPQPEEYYVENIRNLLSESIKKRMMSDVPFGVFLSGGIDSSMNVALMSRHTSHVRTFSVAFKDQPKFDEFQYARQISQQFSTKHHEIVIDEKDLIDFIPKMVFHQDEPIADWVCVPLFYVSKLVRDSGTIVAQVGEGSDEEFSGYYAYTNALKVYHDARRSFFSRLPYPVKAGVVGGLSLLAPHSTRVRNRIEPLRTAANNQFFFWGGAIALWEEDKRRLIDQASLKYPRPLPEGADWGNSMGYGVLYGADRVHSYDFVDSWLKRLAEAGEKTDPLKKIIYLEFKQRLAELLLMRVDKITMATSIEARVPFLDHELVEFAAGIPSDIKAKPENGDFTAKYILKKACRGIIPDNIIDRRKMGFGAPVAEWYNGPLGDEIDHRIRASGLRKRNFIDYDAVERMIAEHRSGKVDRIWGIWLMYNMSRWYDLWIEKERN